MVLFLLRDSGNNAYLRAAGWAESQYPTPHRQAPAPRQGRGGPFPVLQKITLHGGQTLQIQRRTGGQSRLADGRAHQRGRRAHPRAHPAPGRCRQGRRAFVRQPRARHTRTGPAGEGRSSPNSPRTATPRSRCSPPNHRIRNKSRTPEVQLALLEKSLKDSDVRLLEVDQLRQLQAKHQAELDAEKKKTDALLEEIRKLEALLDETPLPQAVKPDIVRIPNSREIPGGRQCLLCLRDRRPRPPRRSHHREKDGDG